MEIVEIQNNINRIVEISVNTGDGSTILDLDNIESMYIETVHHEKTRNIQMKSGQFYIIDRNTYETIANRWIEYVNWRQNNEENKTKFLQSISNINISLNCPCVNCVNHTITNTSTSMLAQADQSYQGVLQVLN